MRHTKYYWMRRDNREGFPCFHLRVTVLTVDEIFTFQALLYICTTALKLQ